MIEVGVVVEVAIVLIEFVDGCWFDRQIVVPAAMVMGSSIISLVTPILNDIRCRPKPLDVQAEFPHL